MVRPWGSNTEGFNVTKTRARICNLSSPAQRLGLEDPIEDVINVLELFVEIERALDLGRGEDTRDLRIRKQQALEIALLVERAHRVALDPGVGVLARDALLHEFQEDGARKHDAARAVQVFAHAFRICHHATHDTGKSPQHIRPG
jgi:hypothetical protein